jgi:hypothetical protein
MSDNSTFTGFSNINWNDLREKEKKRREGVGLPLGRIVYSDNGLTVRAERYTWPVHNPSCPKSNSYLNNCDCSADAEVKRANQRR